MDTLVLICGLPNSGKTSAASEFKKVIHLDDSPGYVGLYEKVRCESGLVVVEGTFCVRERRAELLALKHWDKKICIFMDTPVEECLRRENRNRPKSIVTLHDKILDIPTKEEGWDKVKKISDIMSV